MAPAFTFKCGQRDALEGKGRCQSCTDKDKTKYRETIVEARELRRKTLIESGTCAICGKRPFLTGERSNKHPKCEVCYYKLIAGNARTLKTTKNWKLLKDLMESQRYTCPYSNVKLVLGMNCELDHIESVASRPDLINEVSNMQWVHKDVNRMKRDMSENDFLDLCSLITSCRKRRRQG